jgi:glycosyltransferase involved in cell wall biosynthesis
LSALQAIFPDAPTYTLFYDAEAMKADFGHKNIRTSFLQHVPFGKRFFRYLLPLMTVATESYDLSDYDVIISSASAFAKGVVTPTDAVHISYCHTPTRYLWSDAQSYVDELRAPKIVKWALPPILSLLRLWDKAAADRTDLFIANSKTVQNRIQKYYRRESNVIHPPVDVERFFISPNPKTYFLAGGRLVAYKRFDLVVQAFTELGLPLKIFGAGPAEEALKKMAGPNIEFLGRVSDDERSRLFADAIAFINPQEEDFGLTVVEAMAAGRPVIAYKKGGATETVVEGVTGTFFTEQTSEALKKTVKAFDEKTFDPARIRAHAETFSTERFRKELLAFVEDAWKNSYAGRH